VPRQFTKGERHDQNRQNRQNRQNKDSTQHEVEGEAMTEQQGTDLGAAEEQHAPAGVPQDAMRRLAELQPGRAGAIFTSDLSVNEFLLVREVGFRPLGLVLGSSIYHVGLQLGRNSTFSPRPCTTRASWP